MNTSNETEPYSINILVALDYMFNVFCFFSTVPWPFKMFVIIRSGSYYNDLLSECSGALT